MFYTNLETERLLLKNIGLSDREFIFRQFSDDVVTKYLYDEEPLTDLNGADDIIDFYLQPEPRGQHRWIIQRKTDGLRMGTCGFHCWNVKDGKVEIGYDLKEEFWGNGYMHEALKESIKFAKIKMNIREISAWIYFENQKSINLISRLGFVKVSTSNEVFRGEEYLHNIYSLAIKN